MPSGARLRKRPERNRAENQSQQQTVRQTSPFWDGMALPRGAGHSFSLGLKRQQVRHRGVALLIFKTVEILAVQQVAVGFVGFQLHFEHAGFVV